MKLRRALVLAAIILAAALIRFWHIDAQSLWFDEGIAWHVATQPDLASAVVADPTNPPLYFLLLFISVRFTGDSEVAMRWLSVMIGLLAVPLSYQLARRLFNPTAGVLAALLVACSPPLWWASQEIRMYGLMVALGLVAALAWHRLLERDSRRAWLALWAAELGLLYSHSTGPVFALWLNAVTLLAWLARRNVQRPNGRTWLAGQVGIAVLWSPWLIARFVLLPSANQTVVSPPPLTPELLGQIWQWQWAGSWNLVGQVPDLIAIAMVAFVLWLPALDWRKSATRWLILHALILIAGVLAGLTFVGINLHGRYLVAAVPFTLVALAGGLARWMLRAQDRVADPKGGAFKTLTGSVPKAPPLGSPTRRSPASLLTGAALILFVAISAAGIAIAGTNPAYQHDDVRGMVNRFAGMLSAGDTVVAVSYVDRYDLAYYWPRFAVKAKRLTLPETVNFAQAVAQLPRSGQVVLDQWYAQRGDYRGMMNCLLSHGLALPAEEWQTYGLGYDRYPAAPASAPRMQSFSARTSAGSVSAVGDWSGFAAESSVCMPVQITLQQPTQMPLKAALVVKNNLGWEIARSDAVFARDDQKTSDQISAGEVLTAFPILELPYGAPSGRYSIALRLYDETDLSGYDVLDAGNAPAGKDVAVGDWHTVGANWKPREEPTSVSDTSADGPHLISRSSDVLGVANDPIHNGSRIRLTLLWQGSGALPTLTLASRSGSWQVAVPPGAYDPSALVRLEWREFSIPLDATDSMAELKLPNGEVIADFLVRSIPAEFVEPAYSTPISATLPGVGSLVGYSLAGNLQSIDRSVPLSITLVWRAEATPQTSYTVFVQVLNADGKLIAQSDAPPAQGARPTTGWRPGEYIIDTHQVAFKADATPGPTRLIVGLYDANTGQRVLTSTGSDAISLPTLLDIR